MKFTLHRLLGIALVLVASMAWVVDAEARRMGGGRTFGRQSNITQQRQATPPAAAPTQGQSAQSAAAARSGAAQAPARTGSRWMAPLAGLAAGLGLAALANWLGFGEELATFMLIALLVVAALVVFRLLAARRQTGGPRPAMQGGYGQAGANSATSLRESRVPDVADRYASPAGQGGAAGAAAPLAAGGPAAGAGVPEGFDVDGFLRTAKVQFIRLQAAHDAGDLNDLREFTSPEMFAELKLDIDARGAETNRTDVVTLEAELLGIESTPVDHVASVRFHGMLREEVGGEAKPFDEEWVLVKPISGGGWVLGGIRQLG